MLALIGMGLDTGDISAKALEFISSADVVILESYTSVIGSGCVEFIEMKTGKKLHKLERRSFEEDLGATVRLALNSTVAILVIGDPLIATTHRIIISEAKRQGIETVVMHSSSILSAAIGESGLDVHRFGPYITIPFWSAHYQPTSFISKIAKNKDNNEHTLVLLDIDQVSGNSMRIDDAVKIIGQAQSRGGSEVISKNDQVLVLANVGRPNQKIFYLKFGSLAMPPQGLEGQVISLIIPAKLSVIEEEFLESSTFQ